MSQIQRSAHRIAYHDEGPKDAEAVIFCHSLGLDSSSWRREGKRLSNRRRVVRIDTRGHGESDAPPPPYDVPGLAEDVLAVANALELERFHLVGISLGGLIAIWLGINKPDRLLSLVLASTGAKLGSAKLWEKRIDSVRSRGIKTLGNTILERFFAPNFRDREPAVYARARSRLATCHPDGYIGCCCALRDTDLRDRLCEIDVPTLIFGARHDMATPQAMAQDLHRQLRGSELIVLERSGHIANLEEPEVFGDALTEFLERRASRKN